MTRGPGAPALLAGLFLASLALRPQVVGVGPLLPDVQASLGVSHAVAGLLVTIPVLCMGLFAPPAAALAARVGARRAVAIALALIAGAGIARVAVPGVAGLLVLTVAVGAGMGLGNALMVVAVKERFAHRPLLVTGVYTTGIQVGSAAAAAAAVPLAEAAGGWRAAPLAFSLATAAALVAWMALTRGAPAVLAGAGWPRLPLRSGLVWALVGMWVLMGFMYYGIMSWLPAAYVERGIAASETGWLSALYNVGSLPAGIAAAVLGERISRRRGLVLAGSTMAAATLLLAAAPGGAWVWIVVAGAANGAMFTLTMSLPLEVAETAEDVGAVAGMLFLVGYAGVATAPFLLGGVRDLTGGFEPVLWSFPAYAVAFVALAAGLGRARLARGLGRAPV